MAAIADIHPQAASDAVKIAYQQDGHAKMVTTTDSLNATIESGKIGIVEDANKLIESGLLDVVIEATGLPGIGAELGLAAMERGKHLVMMNVEADVTIGAYLKTQADKLGVVYTLGAGDEPSSCMELIEFVSAMGHKIVAAGKGKNNPLNFDAIPDAYTEEAHRRNMNPRMLVEFVDGSKTMVEMAAIANATGLIQINWDAWPSSNRRRIVIRAYSPKRWRVLSAAGRGLFCGKGACPRCLCGGRNVPSARA